MRPLVVLLLTAALAAAAPSAAAIAAPSKCQRLTGRDIAPAASVKLVAHRNGDDGTDLLGCVLPRGPVRQIASSADFYTTVEGYAVQQIAGRAVLVETTSSSQYAYSQSLSVYHLRTGRSYRVAGTCSMIGGDDCASGGSSTAPAAFVTAKGRAVALVVRAGVAAVTAFNTLGTPRVLDSGPPAAIAPESLRLDAGFASWTNAGIARSAPIAPG
ncbi:MAG: hypothetical protein QOJ89_2888 [bacterium]|jgi:hypothetical protein